MSNDEQHLPIDSPLINALRRSDIARNAADWILLFIGVLGLYMLMQSQLEHEIESSALPPARIEKARASVQQALKMEVFNSHRSNEYEIWADLKDVIERKKPAHGYCQIQPSRPRVSKAKSERRMNASQTTIANTGFELACMVYSNKKMPSKHIGFELLPSLNFMGVSESVFPNSTQERFPIIPAIKQAQEVSPMPSSMKPEGWIETPNGILKFDAKEERWK